MRAWNRIGLMPKLLLVSSLLVVLSVGAGLATTLSVTSRLARDLGQREVSAKVQGFEQAVADQRTRAETLVEMVALSPATQQAFASHDRDGLLAMYAPVFASLQANYGIKQFQFHLPPATSFLRVHKPEKFGDDLSSFRHTVVAANQDRRLVSGIESGVAGLGLRAVAPVDYQGRHIGTVEFGLSLDASFLERYREAFQTDGLLYLPNQETGGLTLTASTMSESPTIDADTLAAVLDGQERDVHTQVAGSAYVVALRPLVDYSGANVGVIGIAIDTSQLAAAQAHARNVGILAGLAVLLIGLALSWLVARNVARSITDPVRRMGEVLSHVAQGDLTTRARVEGSREVAEMARGLNATLDEMSGTLESIGHSSSSLAASSEELSAVSQQLTSTSEQASVQATSAMSSSEEVSANVATVASAAEEMGASIKEIASSATEAAQVAGQALAMAEQTNVTVDKLLTSSTEIGDVLATITSIAEQTNLLALNATIESARAGEAGKGFAIVANEVKELAKQTGEFTDEIATKVQAIQADSSDAAGAIHEIAQIVGRVNELQATIASAVEEQSATTSEITRSVAEAAAGSGEIARNVSGVAEAAGDTANGSTSVLAASQELAHMAEQLDTLVKRFRLDGVPANRAAAPAVPPAAGPHATDAETDASGDVPALAGSGRR